ncbi:hypothetical protein FGO68_gene6540 [Halteria grandinella]|uniref:Centrosomal protein CEP104 Zn finger domain-containing protein n=1 Tax=Halteria grandinella TaxID=5974 RepID=A0A8J8SV96_HALGN|nr:hypothetical protein FGO68_gene6540 [Halteria grandinella]
MGELEGLRPNQLEIVNKAFADIDSGNLKKAFSQIGLDYQALKSARSGPNTQRSQEGAIRDSQQPVHRSTQSFLQPDQGPECEFCKRKKPEFANPDAKDLHLFQDCLFLTACPHCEQVIEIPGLRDHWLTDCEKKDELRKCQTCKQVVHENVFEKHIQEKACFNNVNDTPICALCGVNVGKLPPVGNHPEAWFRHLIVDKCHGNPRK